MTIFKTYEGFFDFLKKKEKEKEEILEETPLSIKVRNFLETEDSKSIEEIFKSEGIKISKFFFLEIGRKIVSMPVEFGIKFKDGATRGEGKEYDIIEFIKKHTLIANNTSIRFSIIVEHSIKQEEKIKDVANLIQSLFDFEKYEIFHVSGGGSNTVIKFTF